MKRRAFTAAGRRCRRMAEPIMPPKLAWRAALACMAACALSIVSACASSRRAGPSDFHEWDISLPAEGEYDVLTRSFPRRDDWPMITNTGAAFVYPPQKVVASWYGYDFAGRETSNGERFNPRRLTAAHKTLPFNTLLRVTKLDNGKSVIVRVNDRGPWVKGRDLDLSREAAAKIGMIGAGVAKCKIEVLEYPLVETNGPSGNG